MFPFDIVHYDIWGSNHVPCTLGYRYCATFIDDLIDFSRCTVITLKDRS